MLWTPAFAGMTMWVVNIQCYCDDMVVEIGHSDAYIDETISTASMIFVDMLKIINEEYEMKFEDELEKLAKAIENTK